MRSRLARSTLVLSHAPAVSSPASSLWTAIRLSQTHSAVEKRPSRRRYAALNKGGRVGQAKELLAIMKTKSKDEAKTFFDNLLPRDKLDVVRLMDEKRRKRKADHISSVLPKYYSVIFEKNYFFKEGDVLEESTLGRGPGGQATNRRMQTAIVRHKPSNIVVKFSRFPSLWLNRRAARELLNLRLEEHLLGAASRLGKARAAKRKRQQRRQRTVEYLAKKGSRLQARAAYKCHWAAFLEGTMPLPESAVQQMGLATTRHTEPVTVALLFGAECNNWWSKLKAAVNAASRTESANRSEYAAAKIPLMLRYLFPATYADTSESEREQLAKCTTSEAARMNVARAFVCFCELFGLRLRGAPPQAASTDQRCLLQKDGLNWVEFHSRMHQNGHLTDAAQVCWPHVYVSLRELGMQAEARAIVLFFKREAKCAAAGQGESAAWAQEALTYFAQAVRGSTISEVPHGTPMKGAAGGNDSDSCSNRVDSQQATHATTA